MNTTVSGAMGERVNGIRRLVRPLAGTAVPLLAVFGALVVGAVMLIALDANAIDGYRALFSGAFGGADALADTAIKAMPLLLVGVGICIAFRAGVINIGGEGQIIILLISEDLDEVLAMSDRVIVLLEGEITGEVDRADATVERVGLLMTGVTEPVSAGSGGS